MKKKAPQEFSTITHKVYTSYKNKYGVSYPLGAKDIAIIKKLCGIYGPAVVCALWDEFLAQDWSWYDRGNKKVLVGHDLAVFWSKLTVLLEEGAYKKRLERPREPKIPGIPVSGGLKPIAGVIGDIKKAIPNSPCL